MPKLFELIDRANAIRGYNPEYLDEILGDLKNFLVFDGGEIHRPQIISPNAISSVDTNNIEEITESLQKQIEARQPVCLLFFFHGVNIVELGGKIIVLAQDEAISVEELLQKLQQTKSLPKTIIFANCSQLNLAEQQKISHLFPDTIIGFIGSDRDNFFIYIDPQETSKSESVLKILQASRDDLCKIRMWKDRMVIASQSKELDIFGFLSMYLAEEQDKLRKAQLNRLLDCPRRFGLMVNFLQNPDLPMPKIYPALFDDVTDIEKLYREKHNLKEVNFDLEKVATTLAGLYCKSLDGEVINMSQINIDKIAKKLKVSPEILLAKTNNIIASKLALDLKPLAIALGKMKTLDEIYKTKFFELKKDSVLDLNSVSRLFELLGSSDFSYEFAKEKYQEYKLVFHQKRSQLKETSDQNLTDFLKSTCEDESMLLPDKKRIIFEIAIKYVDLLKHCPDDVKKHLACDYDFFTALCKRKGCALKYACADFKDDKALALLALENNPEAYYFIGEKLRTTKGFFEELERLMQEKHPEYWSEYMEVIANFFEPNKDLETAQATQVAESDKQEKITTRL